MINIMASKYIAFDTLNFVKRLEAAGVSTQVAEVQAQLQAEINEQLFEHVVECKPLLDEIKIAKDGFADKNDILQLKTDINAVRTELKSEITSLRTELKDDISDLRGDFIKLEGKFVNLRNELIVKLGGIMVACTVALGAIMTLLISHTH